MAYTEDFFPLSLSPRERVQERARCKAEEEAKFKQRLEMKSLKTFRVHLDHERSVTVRALSYSVGQAGELSFKAPTYVEGVTPVTFGPGKWFWVEEEKS